MNTLLNKTFATLIFLGSLFSISSFSLKADQLLYTVNTGDSTWEVHQLTENNIWDTFPITRNGKIVWKGVHKNSGDTEILWWNGKNRIKNISHNTTSNEFEPSFDGANICWRTYLCDNDTCEGSIYFYNGNKNKKIVSYDLGPFNPNSGYPPSWHSLAPTTHNGYVTWAAYDGNDYEIFLWKDNKTIQVTNNDTDDYEPQVYDGLIAFTGNAGGVVHIYFWNGTGIVNISENNLAYQKNDDPYLWNGKMVWSGWVNGTGGNQGSFQIFYYNGIQTVQISAYEGGRNSFEPVLFENMMAWHWWDGHDWEILLYDGNQITQITDNEVDDLEVSLDENMMTWHRFTESHGPTEIMYAKRINK
ncbi:MAG: alkaline phosphatase [Candidatus Brocadiaceae bacterium]|nr:alkaline phosphatase [Candidatus Brocadiaceae bacterium]